LNVHVLEDLVVESVAAVILEDNVLGENVLDEGNVVLCLSLGQSDRLGRDEQRAELGELRYLGKVCSVLINSELVALGSRSSGQG